MDKSDNLNSIRHSLAHLLAAAVLKKYPKTKLGIGPVIENGFYYDFDFGAQKISDADFPELEAEMRRAIKEGLIVEGKKVTPASAKKFFKGQPFKLELIKDFVKEKKSLTLYSLGDYFTDLCKGGHVKSTNEINPDAFRLTYLAGAYWKGDEKNPQLTRVYAAAFNTKEELDVHIAHIEEAKKRDHRKLGKELELFHISDEVGPGLPLFYPKGALLRRLVENYIIELQERMGYEPIWIPHITKDELYKISGHLDKFDAMYPPMKLKSEADYYLKPMNCPHFMMLYKSRQHSYRELPIRWTSTTTNYRYEKSGELTGLTRVRSLTQDDCHVFATPEHIESEISLMLDMIDEVYKTFGFKDFWVRVSVHDPTKKEKYIGSPDVWKQAETSLEKVVGGRGWEYEVGVGEAAFYGPKLDFMFKDVIGRTWQLSTIQLDMNLPKRFNLVYTDADGKEKEPVVIHRAILGSTERFLGILIEHFAGAFPLWLSPVQARVLAVSDKQQDYAQEIIKTLKQENIRAELAESNETLGKRIREAQMQKIPYILVVGEKESQINSVNVRHRSRGDKGEMRVDLFVQKIKKEIKEKTI